MIDDEGVAWLKKICGGHKIYFRDKKYPLVRLIRMAEGIELRPDALRIPAQIERGR